MGDNNKNVKMNKRRAVLEYMMTHEYITDEIGHDITHSNRLGSIIFDLRKKYVIRTVMVDDVDIFGNPVRYGRYYLEGEIAV